jgi:hypothetical protein
MAVAVAVVAIYGTKKMKGGKVVSKTKIFDTTQSPEDSICVTKHNLINATVFI